MEKKILVTYATVHGSTREIAEDIYQTLTHDAVPVELQPISRVKSLSEYSAVILGAPQYMFRWHKDALNFLSRNRRVLENETPLAIFAGGSIENAGEEELTIIRTNLEKDLSNNPWLKPVSLQYVGGKFDPANLHFPYNLIPVLKHKPAVDFRDWPAIRAWARSLPATFESTKMMAAV